AARGRRLDDHVRAVAEPPLPASPRLRGDRAPAPPPGRHHRGPPGRPAPGLRDGVPLRGARRLDAADDDPDRPGDRRAPRGARARRAERACPPRPRDPREEVRRPMPATVLYMSMSLDGFIAGPGDGPGNGLGDDGHRLHAWLADGGADPASY